MFKAKHTSAHFHHVCSRTDFENNNTKVSEKERWREMGRKREIGIRTYNFKRPMKAT